MANPRLYFTISKNPNGLVFIPVRMQCRDLDKKFADTAVIKANIDGYNSYTKEFAQDHAKSSDMCCTDDYEWNPQTFTFNFYELTIATDADYDRMSIEPCTFEFDKEYKGVSINNIETLIKVINRENPCPSIDDGFYVEKKTWQYLVRNIRRHVNTMLIGPTGTGKTELIQKICEQLNIPCNIYDMGAMQDPLTDLLGSHRLENGTSVFDYAKFVYDVQKPGVILLDELSRAPFMTNNILFPCLDNRRTLPVEIADSKSDRTIKIHPECTFIATANIGSEYVGTNDIDAALMNRFLPLQLDYLPSDIETKVLEIRTGISHEFAVKLVEFATQIRSEYKAGNLSKPVSMRELLACGELIADGFSLLDCIEFVITNKYINTNFSEENKIIKKLLIGF